MSFSSLPARVGTGSILGIMDPLIVEVMYIHIMFL